MKQTPTHQKHPYLAHAIQWDGDNTPAVFEALKGFAKDVYPSVYNVDHIYIRHEHGVTVIRKGWWVVTGENGEVKVYSDEVFNIKYEAL